MLSTVGSTFLRNFRAQKTVATLLTSNAAAASYQLPSRKLMSGADSYELRHQVESTHESSSKWKSYRILSMGLLGGCIGSLAFPGNALIDFATVTLLVHHNHFGIKSIIADYAPLFLNKWFIEIIYGTWLLISIVTLALLYSFNYNGAGFSRSVSGFLKL